MTYFVGGAEGSIPVVLLHGGGTDHAMLSWRDTILALLEAGYRVNAPNYPGCGDSPPDHRPSTMDNLIRYLEESRTPGTGLSVIIRTASTNWC